MWSACVCRPGESCRLECLKLKEATHAAEVAADRVDYLLAELRVAALRARLMQSDIEAVGLALKGGLITPEQALEDLADCDCLTLVIPQVPRAREADNG